MLHGKAPFLLVFFHVSFKKNSVVHSSNGAVLGGNWPLMQIKSSPIYACSKNGDQCRSNAS